jgi:hypothetical protein
MHAAVDNATWRLAKQLARSYLARIGAEARFSQRLGTCIAALAQHMDAAGGKIGWLG